MLIQGVLDDLGRDFRVNGVCRLPIAISLAMPELIKAKGSIINISSTLSKGVMPEISVYSASKTAIDHSTRVLAVAYGPQGVRVNAVAPGFTVTEITKDLDQEFVKIWQDLSPLGGFGQPDEVASVVAFPATEDAKWVTGQIIQAGGGVMM